MSEWLDLMLDEVRRKKQERKEAQEEAARRTDKKDEPKVREQNKDRE